MNTPYLLVFGYIATHIPWTLAFLITQLFGVRLYVLQERDECKRIQSRISSWCSHTADGNKGYGYAIGFWYILSITILPSDSGDKYSAWIIATSESYDKLTAKKEDTAIVSCNFKEVPKTDMNIYERSGSFNNAWFRKRVIKMPHMTPRPYQTAIIAEIKQHQAIHGHTVVYLHGEPGKGKSIIGVLLTDSYKGSYCNTLKPWQPGDCIAGLYSDVEPTASAPLILAFDEFDGPLMRIHVGIPAHAKLPIQLQDKASWNQMLDEFHIGMYPNMILLLTSNKSPSFISDMDPSYIREGRVDLIFEI